MSQHVTETCNESNGLWLPLTEYAVKSGVSLSTIRRKIKSNTIQYRLEKGRYLILFQDEAGDSSDSDSMLHTPLNKVPERRPIESNQQLRKEPSIPTGVSVKEDAESDRLAIPLVEKAVRMVSQAFEHTLREKDERIRLLEQRNGELEERLNELRTLVRVLEDRYEVRY